MKHEPYIGKYYNFENKVSVDIPRKTVGDLLESLTDITELTKNVNISAIDSATITDQDDNGAHLVLSYSYLDEDEYERKPIKVLKPTLSVTDDLCMLEVGFENSNLLSDFEKVVAVVKEELNSFMSAYYLDVSYSSVAGDDPDPVGFFRVYFKK